MAEPIRERATSFAASRRGAIPVALALITLATFAPSLWNGFVDWDDTRNFLDNPHYRGLGWGQLRWMATTTLLGHYVPLTWVTFGLDYTLFGMNPAGYHLTSMLLHMADAVLFYFVTLRLLRAATSLSRGQLR